jgi:hypothetical protein
MLVRRFVLEINIAKTKYVLYLLPASLQMLPYNHSNERHAKESEYLKVATHSCEPEV